MAQESWKIEKDETDCEILKPPAASSSTSAKSPSSSPPPPPPLFVKSPPEAPAQRSERTEAPTPDSELEAPSADTPSIKEEAVKPVRFTIRCSSCQKRVGLTGFRCRCGSLFCGRHRYSDTHDCSFDYKGAGREQISKANPLIRAAKIIKI